MHTYTSIVLFHEKKWIKISCGYAHLHIMSFLTTTTKFHEILWAVLEELRWQEKQDWLTYGKTDWLTEGQMDGRTDWLKDGSKTLGNSLPGV